MQTDSRPRGDGVNNAGGCYGSVLLDNDLWQSLTAMNGHAVPWVHGCVLDHGHDGDHGAPLTHLDEEPQQWVRWSDTGSARLQRLDPSPPGRHSRPRNAHPDRPTTPSPTTGAHAHQPKDVRLPETDAQALWAIAAALERLADAVERLRNPPGDKGTR